MGGAYGGRPLNPSRRNLHRAMTAVRALILALALLLLPRAAAQAADPRLVPDVSSRAIDIQYSFTGEELLLFGAILYPGQRLPDAVRADTRISPCLSDWFLAALVCPRVSKRYRAGGHCAFAIKRPDGEGEVEGKGVAVR